MLGRIAEEYGPERVATVAFHVDYFNEPWEDPHSDPRFSRREMQYSLIFDREHKLKNPNYLYLTPLLMIDGRTPMVGSNDDAPAKARAAIGQALAREAEVRLDVAFRPAPGDPEEAAGPGGGPSPRRTLEVAVSAGTPALAGREVLVEVVTVEDGLTTKVGSGELAGRTYVGRDVARAFAFKGVKVPRNGSETLSFPVGLKAGWEPSRCRLVVLAQDEATGRVYQARVLPWSDGPPPR